MSDVRSGGIGTSDSGRTGESLCDSVRESGVDERPRELSMADFWQWYKNWLLDWSKMTSGQGPAWDDGRNRGNFADARVLFGIADR